MHKKLRCREPGKLNYLAVLFWALIQNQSISHDFALNGSNSIKKRTYSSLHIGKQAEPRHFATTFGCTGLKTSASQEEKKVALTGYKAVSLALIYSICNELEKTVLSPRLILNFALQLMGSKYQARLNMF